MEKLLKDILGDIIEEVDSKQLNIGFWAGKVDINNMRFKPNLLQTYGIPVRIKYSSISTFSVKIPWKNLFSSPLTIDIRSVFVLCEFAENGLLSQERA